MRLLLDTQIMIWLATDDPRLSRATRALISNGENEIVFSVISLWETVIKAALGRSDFGHSAAALRSGAQRAGWEELAVDGDHALAVAGLPRLHGDPFDRLLVAQATTEGMTLLTADRTLARYGGVVRVV